MTHTMNPVPSLPGRAIELAHIDAAVRNWGSRQIIFVDGPDGIGKSHLLHTVQEHYRTRPPEHPSLRVARLLDFADPLLHIPQNNGYTLAHDLNAKLFDPYLFVLNNWSRMNETNVQRESLEQAEQALAQTFVNCFNLVSSQQRVLLLCDNMDLLAADPEALQRMLHLLQGLDNVVAVLAGRNTTAIASQMQRTVEHEVSLLQLGHMADDDSVAYLAHTHEQPLELSAAKHQQLLTLAQGVPLLLDTSVLLARQGKLAHLLDQAHPSVDEAATRQTFVDQVAQTLVAEDTPASRVLLLLAHIFPLTAAQVGFILGLAEPAAEDLMHEVAAYPLVKHLPRGRYELYDMLRNALVHAVWTQRDPDLTQRIAYSWAASQLFAREAEALRTLLRDHQATELNAGDVRTTPPNDDPPFQRRRVIERQCWNLGGRQLAQTLYASLDEGIEVFAALFEEATASYRLRFRGTLFTYLEPYLSDLNTAQHYHIDSRRVEHYLDQGQFIQARQLATTLLAQDTLAAEQRIDILLRLATAEIQLGYLDQGVAYCERAMRTSKLHNVLDRLVQAQNARGQAFRAQGQHNLALSDYLEAYQRSLQCDNLEQSAWILTNISFVSALRGDRQAAFESCRSAIKLWHRIDYRRGLAAAYYTLGEIHVRFNQPIEAMTYLTRALYIFKSENDRIWLCQVYTGRAFVYQSQGELDKATAELEEALRNQLVYIMPRILYMQGLIAWDQRDLEHAQRKLEASRQLSQEIGDQFHDYKGFADLIELAWEFQDFSQWQRFARELEDLYADRTSIEALRLRGSCLRKLADLAICDGAYDTALEFYEEGFPLLAENEIHERYTIRAQMKQTNDRIRDRVSANVLSRLGSALAQFWRSNTTLVVKYPEALLTFYEWERQNSQPPLLLLNDDDYQDVLDFDQP